MTTEEARLLLGVTDEITLSQAEIKKAYKKARFIHHPDKGGSHERYVRLPDAYQTLVAELIKKKTGVILIPDFMDPNVIAKCRRIEYEALNGDEISRKIYEIMRTFPGVAWPLVWPPTEYPSLTLLAESNGEVAETVVETKVKPELETETETTVETEVETAVKTVVETVVKTVVETEAETEAETVVTTKQAKKRDHLGAHNNSGKREVPHGKRRSDRRSNKEIEGPPYKRPPGRPKKDMEWCTSTGTYRKAEIGNSSIQSGRISKTTNATH